MLVAQMPTRLRRGSGSQVRNCYCFNPSQPGLLFSVATTCVTVSRRFIAERRFDTLAEKQ